MKEQEEFVPPIVRIVEAIAHRGQKPAVERIRRQKMSQETRLQ